MSTRFQHEIVTRTQPLSAWVHLHDSKAPQRIAPHWHQGIELSYTLSGHIDDFTINGRDYQSKSGSILVVNSQLIHSVRTINTANSCALSIIYPYDYVHRLYPSIEHEVIAINEPAYFSEQQSAVYLDLQGDLYQLALALQQSTAYTNLRIEALTTAILQRLLIYFTTAKESSGVIYGKAPQIVERIQKITMYVNQHYTQPISLSDIAQQINVTKEYLTRFFKQHMEMTVGEYISLVRAQHAYEDLLGQRGNLTAIATMNGFPSTRALNHAFQAVYHQTAATIYKTEHTLD
ncbi:AraC family transcriptional regulator [Lactiplantibacillus plantarum]|uniref:AraC family transcriptional regulator n=1 Tax=Lactiplantibacillus plantarum TaxID=1590 RepID=UPI000C179DCF|nr:AraC family transcriptional regulator [Lactiplantibacillus plantarum]PKX51824.1 AraC family transcriptional regulator [Lactiplantibacillus plantarum]